ncbi:hypothetical protein IJI18_02625 [Candidatus Saccharibacteria bacterium]|nr:hypothetical protein [Candidatus Saccharibacteria bacterium]
MNSVSDFDFHIGKNRIIRIVWMVTSFVLFLLAFLSIFPIINHKESAEATAGVAEIPTITITSASTMASVDITPSSSIGTFRASDNNSNLAFNVKTSNYTGYNLTLSARSGDTNGKLTNTSHNDTLDSITTAIDANTFETDTTNTYINKWGIKPSKLNSTKNTNYLPAPIDTTGFTMDTTSTANPTTANNYTIDIAARVDYTKPAGTYTNTYILTATANYVAYHIDYYDLSGISSSTLNDSGLTWTNPTSGTAKLASYTKIADQSASNNSAATITLAPISTSTGSALATPTRHTYTFAGWCRNSTNHTEIGVNQTVTAIQNSSNKVTAYHNPGTMCNGAIPDYNTSTDNFIKAGDTNFKLDPTKDNTNIKLYAVWKPTTFTEAGIATNANMQSMTNAICKATTPNQFTTLKDARGSSASTYVSYVIIKLLDGNCWMADNLNFDAYTYKNNITAANTHAEGTVGSTALARFKTTTSRGTGEERYATSAINSNSTYASGGNWTAGYTFSDPLINRGGVCKEVGTQYMCLYPYQKGTYNGTTYTGEYTNDTTINLYGKPFDTSTGEGVANITYDFGPGGYKIGAYYNYCAASLGSYCYGDGTSYGTSSGNATEADICPAGWKLPTGGTDEDFQNLYNKIENITTTPANATNLLSFQTMLSTPISGRYQTDSAGNQGKTGYFWSSTYWSALSMHRVGLRGTSVSAVSQDNRHNGYSIRCIAQ